MKTQALLIALCLIANSFIATSIYSQDTSIVKSTFIGSHGYLLESTSKKVALDAHIYWEGSHWEYIKPPLEVKSQIENAETPFHNIDLILISHDHLDHFNVSMIEGSMNKNTNAIVITTPQVYAIIESEASDLSSIKDRIWVPEIEFYNSKDTIINEIPLTITCIDHGSEKTSLYVFSFILDNIRFTQLNSWNTITDEMYDTLGFNKERADVAFLGYDYIMNGTKLNLFKNYINPIFSVISHIDGATSSKINSIQKKVDELNDDYPMNLITTPMEEFIIKKVNNAIFITQPETEPETSKTRETNANQLRVYPNPAENHLYVNWPTTGTKPESYLLSDLNGKTVKQGKLNSETINVSEVNRGIYVLSVISNTQRITNKISIE